MSLVAKRPARARSPIARKAARAFRGGSTTTDSRSPVRPGIARTWGDPEVSSGLVALMDSMALGLLLVDEHGVVQLASHRAGELLDLPTSALEGTRVGELPKAAAALIEAAARAPRGRREVVQLPIHDARAREIGFTVERVHTAGSARAFLIAFQDLTPIHELQEQRDRLLKLATVGEVLPSLLHELKNPFAAIATSVELLIEESHDARAQEDLHAILVEVRRAVLSLDGLGFVGRELRSKTPMAIDHAVREACHLLGSRASRSQIALRCDAPDLPLLPLDAAAIRAVIFNLVNNAMHACAQGGHIDVSCGLSDGGAVFELTVADDGCGMSPAVLARCTELFFTTKRAGSGIGLALCRKVAEEAGGRLDVRSAAGEGTSATLRVPVRSPGLRN